MIMQKFKDITEKINMRQFRLTGVSRKPYTYVTAIFYKIDL